MPAVPGFAFGGPGGFTPAPTYRANGIGEAIQNAGAKLEGAAAVLEQRADEDGRISAMKTLAEKRLAARTALMDAENSGEDLTGIAAKIESQYTKELDDAERNAPNDYARRYLQLGRSDTLLDLRERATGIEAKYRVGKTIIDTENLLDFNASSLATNPDLFPKVFAESKALVASLRVPIEARAQLEDKLSSLGAVAMAGMIEKDPYSAARELESGQWDKYLDPSARVSLYNGAQAGVRSREAEARARAAESRAAAAEAAGEYLAGADDYFAYRAAGNPPDAALEAKYSPEAIAALPIKNAGNLAKKAADVQIRGDAMLAVRAASSPEERRAIADDVMIRASNPENYQFNAETARLVVSDIQNFEAQLEKAPGDVAFGSSRVQAAVDSGNGVSIVSASYAEQERLGVPAFKRQPLSESYAASVADQIATLPPDQQAAALQDMAKSYGSYWPDVLKQIGGKLPGPLAVAATMPEGRAATRVAETAGLKIDELTAGLDKDASRNVDEAISDNERFASLATVLGSQVGGAKTLGQYGEAIKRSALLLMREGKSEAEAVEQATAEITADIDFRSVGQSVVAIPTAANPDMVEAGLSSIASNFDVTDVDLPPSATGMNEADVKAAYASSIRRNGQWVPDGSGKGVYLYVEGDPVTRGGAPVLFTWDDLKAAGLPKDGFMFEGQR